MTDPDLKQLADLWQQPDTAAQEQFDAAARKVRKKARLLGYVDVALAALLVAGMVLGFVLKPEPVSAVIAGLLIAATLWLGWWHWKLRHISRTLDTSDRQAFIASSVRHAKAGLLRATLSLCFFPVLALLAILSKLSAREGGRLDHPLDSLATWATSIRGVVVIVMVAVIIVLLDRSRRKCRAELDRLAALSRDYRDETKLDETEG